MDEKIIVISYFDQIVGPNILYSSSDIPISEIENFPNLTRILEFNEEEGVFLFSFRKFQTLNILFFMKSELARGGQDLVMISCVIRASYFKNELTDVFKYLEGKKPILKNFSEELKSLPNFTNLLHKYVKNPNIKQITKYCKSDNIELFSLCNKYFNLIFPESEVRIITQDLNLQKKVFLFGPKGSGKSTFLKTIEAVQFYNLKNLDLSTRILGVMIDNIMTLDLSDFLDGKVELTNAQGVIFIFKNPDHACFKEVNSFIERFLNSASNNSHGKIPIAMISNELADKTPFSEEEIKKNIKIEEVKKHEIPLKFYSFNVWHEDPRLMEPLKWLIKEMF